jgi:ribosomal protein L23
MVDDQATKIDVKNAFKTLYGVDVEKVNVLYTRPKFHNTKKGIAQKKGIEKKAMLHSRMDKRSQTLKL